MGFSMGIAAAVWHGLYFMSVFSIYMSRHEMSAMLAEQPFLISICYERCPYCYFLKPVVLVLSSLRFYLFKDLMERDPGWASTAFTAFTVSELVVLVSDLVVFGYQDNLTKSSQT